MLESYVGPRIKLYDDMLGMNFLPTHFKTLLLRTHP